MCLPLRCLACLLTACATHISLIPPRLFLCHIPQAFRANMALQKVLVATLATSDGDVLKTRGGGCW